MVKPGIKKGNEFYSRVGVCYTNKDGSYPTGNFAIKRGYRSWGGNGVDPNDADLRKVFISLDLQYPETPNPVTEAQQCFNLGAQNPPNPSTVLSMAAPWVVRQRASTPGRTTARNAPLSEELRRSAETTCPCAPSSPRRLLPRKRSPTLTDPATGKPTASAFDKYFYDTTSGMLFFYVVQDRPNAKGTSPLEAARATRAILPTVRSRTLRRTRTRRATTCARRKVA